MNCTLRAWRPEDADALSALLNNKKILDNLRDGIPYPYHRSDAEQFIREMRSADPQQVFAFAITADDQLAGSIAIFRQSNIHFRTGELGYYIAEPFWGQGIGTCAVAKICKFIFTNTDIVRIFAEPFAYNTASCRILEKNGFHHEGTLKSNACKHGVLLDMKMYALIKTDSSDCSF